MSSLEGNSTMLKEPSKNIKSVITKQLMKSEDLDTPSPI